MSVPLRQRRVTLISTQAFFAWVAERTLLAESYEAKDRVSD